jgi:hypothetical protein
MLIKNIFDIYNKFRDKLIFIYMSMIAGKFNMEDVFFRDLTVCVLDTLEGQIKWVNRFSSGDVRVEVPFYYSLSGDERFLLDTFADDVVSENRFVELNTDVIPRGHITLKSFNINSDEFANPNVWLRMVVENDFEIRKVLARVRAVPITVDYELVILLSNEVDTFKCSQAILDTLWIYKFMYFEHNFMNIDAVILMPDTNSIEIAREKNLTSDNTIKLSLSFQVQTYYPAFRKDRVSMEGYPTFYGSGGTYTDRYGESGNGTGTVDTSGGGGNTTSGGGGTGTSGGGGGTGTSGGGGGGGTGTSGGGGGGGTGTSGGGGTGNDDIVPLDPAYPSSPPWPGSPILPGPDYAQPVYGATGSFGGWPAGSAPSDSSDYFIYAPKRTRWFNNILRARESAIRTDSNPNANNGLGNS